MQQNAVKIRQIATGLEFIALVPYYNMLEKRAGIGGSVTFDLDGRYSLTHLTTYSLTHLTIYSLTHLTIYSLSVGIRVGRGFSEGSSIGIQPGNYTDNEYFLRYLAVGSEPNPHNYIKLSLPGAIPEGSKFHYCVKGTAKQMRSDACMGSYKSDSLMWRSSVLGDWLLTHSLTHSLTGLLTHSLTHLLRRKQMNLPPRLGDIRMLANKLHLYGGDEEQQLLNAANHLVAGLPLPVDQMPAEEQLMMMGLGTHSLT